MLPVTQQGSTVNCSPLIMKHRLCGLAVKTLAQRPGGKGSIPGRFKPKTLKLVLVADPPGVWHYGFSARSGWPDVRIIFNLDAKKQLSDERLWQALEDVQMKEVVEALPERLDTVLSEGGDNFSVGQRQLLCMARAFLRDSKIIVMDEATSSIDTDTDGKIQAIIQSDALRGKTVITIAHRMTTIMKYDRVMVLEFGELKEFGPPAELASDEGSLFYSLLHGASDNELK
ncbi:multidrug resistance-associated protein 1 [Elysia marginata]|uniref:Multidrug resistance-associated protein 1 n=1 Tax=Elysia marginata TaxID=1093978 RepID=A0AAV4IXQ8_9GAST|nr:multidrug resistance-associated protein 1 [Elysia marginata]